MSAINYTYHIDIGAGYTQVYPSGDWSLKITKAEEDFPFCKDYRIKFDGEFIFSGTDYYLIKTADCCDKIDLRIECNSVDYWFGYFAYPYDLDFDEDRCEVSGTPKPLDKYYYFDLYADFKEQLVTSDNLTWQRNFPSDPNAAAWEADVTDCVPCEPIVDMIQRWLGPPLVPTGFTLNFKSAFFNDSDDGFPTGGYPVIDGYNYVTGCKNKLDHVVVVLAADIYDVAGPWGVWPVMSFNDFIEIIHNQFNTWWYIDEQGDFRIEHILFWDLYYRPPYLTPSYDLVTTIDNGRWLVNTSKYDYRVEEIPKEEQWNWNTEFMKTFVEEKFNYYDCFLPGTSRFIKEYSLSDVTNDMEYIVQTIATFPASSPPDSVLMFLRCIEAADLPVVPPPDGPWTALPVCADFVVWFSEYLIDGADHLNAHLSPTNLLANYWLHDRPLWTGFMPKLSVEVNFKSTWKTLRQMEFSFPVCCGEEAWKILTGVPGNNPQFLYQFGINFNRKITTQYGNGELYTGTIKDGMLNLQLIYEDKDCAKEPTDEWSDVTDICEL